MAALSDTTIVAAIKTLIEGTSSLYNASGPANPTLIHKVYTEPNLDALAQQNYCKIIPPGGTLKKEKDKIKELGDAKLTDDLMGNQQMTIRPFIIIFTFKQVQKENNARIYNAVKNFRDAIKADETLSTTGVDGSVISSWGYTHNKNNRTIQDGAVMTLKVICTESF